jgi:tripartite ATP-independent transporter DctM subunit
MISGILMGGFIILLLLDVPIAFALLGAAMIAMYFTGSLMPAANSMIATVDSFTLLTIPLFIMAGDLMNRGGITSRLVDLSNALVGHLKGALAQTGVVAAMLFGSVSGSAVADTAAVGSAVIPPMLKQGYNPAFSAALIATSGTIGMLMPTSITLIIFAITANLSIAKLLVAGLIPGLFMGILLCVYSYFYAVRNKIEFADRFTWGKLFRAVGKAIIPGITPGIIVTGIVGGVFTPTEAGAVAVVYAACIGAFVYHELDWKGLLDSAVHTIVITGLVMFLIFTSYAFSWVITLERVPEMFSSLLLGGTSSPLVVFLLMNVFLLAIGTFLDPTPTILITVPIFLPIAMQFGIDPTHFAIVFVINMAIAQVSPPAGAVLFTACGLARVSMAQVTPPLLPLMGVQLLSMVVVMLVPSLVLFLPNLFFAD